MSTLADIICEKCGADSSHFIKNEGTWYCVKCSYPRRKPLFSNLPDPLNTDLDETIVDDPHPSASPQAPASPPPKRASLLMSTFSGMGDVPSPGGATPAKPRASPRTPLAERSQNSDMFAPPYPSRTADEALEPRGSPVQGSPISQKELSTAKGSPLAEINTLSMSAIEQFCETPVIGMSALNVIGSNFTPSMAIPLDLDKSLTAKPSPFKPELSPKSDAAAPFSVSKALPSPMARTPSADVENRENAERSNSMSHENPRPDTLARRVSNAHDLEPAKLGSPLRMLSTQNLLSEMGKSSPVTSSAAMVDQLTLQEESTNVSVAADESAMEDDVDVVEESLHADLPKYIPARSINSAPLSASPNASAQDQAAAVDEVQPPAGSTVSTEPVFSSNVVHPIMDSSEVTHPKSFEATEIESHEIEHANVPEQRDTEVVPMQDTPISSPVKSPVQSQASTIAALGLDVPSFPALGSEVTEAAVSTASIADDSPMCDADTAPATSGLIAADVSQAELAQTCLSTDTIDDVISDRVPKPEESTAPVADTIPAAVPSPAPSEATTQPLDAATARTSSAPPVPSTPLSVPPKEKRVTASPPPNTLRTLTHTTSPGSHLTQSASQTQSEVADMAVPVANPAAAAAPSTPTVSMPTGSSLTTDAVRTPVLATAANVAIITTPVTAKAAGDGDAMLTDADFAEMLDEMRTPCASDRSTSDFSDSAGSLQSPPFAQPLFSPQGRVTTDSLLSPPLHMPEKRSNPSLGQQRFFPALDGVTGTGNPMEKSRKLTQGASPRSQRQTLSQVPPRHVPYDPETAGILAVSQKLAQTAAELKDERQKRYAQQEEMDTLRVKEDQRRAEQKDFIMKIRQLEREKNELYARVESEASEKSSLERRIQNDAVVSRGKIEVLENENQRLREKERLHRNMHEERQKECRTLRSQLDELQTKHNDLLVAHTSVTQQQEELQARFEALKMQASAQLAEGGKLYQMARDNLKNTQLQLKEKSSTLDAVNLELANAKSELDSQTKLKTNYMQRAGALAKSLAAKEQIEAVIKTKYATQKANFEAQQQKFNDAVLLKEQFMNELIEKKEENANLGEQILKLRETQGDQAQAQQQLQRLTLEQSSLKTRLFDLNDKYEKTKKENGELLQYVDQLLKQQGK